MCSLTEALFYLVSGTFGTLAAGVIWMKVRGDYKHAKAKVWLGVIGLIFFLYCIQDTICGWPLAI